MFYGYTSQVVHAPHALRWRVSQAPEPEEVVWKNLHIPAWQRAIRRGVVAVLTFLLIVFYMIPISFVASLTTLENLEELLPFIRSITRISVLGNIIQVSAAFENRMYLCISTLIVYYLLSVHMLELPLKKIGMFKRKFCLKSM